MYPNYTLDQLKTIQQYRTMMGENPQHNRHIIEQADAMEAAFNENNQQMMIMFQQVFQRLEKLEAEVEAIKQTVKNQSRNNPSTPIPVDIVPTQSSLRKLRSSIYNVLN